MSNNTLSSLAVTKIIEEVPRSEDRQIVESIFLKIDANQQRLPEAFLPSGQQYLDETGDLLSIFSEGLSHDQVVARLNDAIQQLDSVLSEALDQIAAKIRPLEATYQQLYSFFTNAESVEGDQALPAFHILNGDSRVMQHPEKSTTFAILKRFLEECNDRFQPQRTICTLVLPAFLDDSMGLQTKLEDECLKRGVLLVSSLMDDRSIEQILEKYRQQGGAYEFLVRSEQRAAVHVVTADYLKMRKPHYYENSLESADDGLYIPASLAFAGAMVRTDKIAGISQGPLGYQYGQIQGAMGSRFDPTVTEAGQLALKSQVVPIIRNDNGRLCFYGARPLAQQRRGPYKFFSTVRIVQFVERLTKTFLLGATFQRFDPEVVDEVIDKPLRRELERQKRLGTIQEYDLDIRRPHELLMAGIVPVTLKILPTGPIERFQLDIRVPLDAASMEVSVKPLTP